MRFVCFFFSDDPNASLHSDGKLDFVSSADITAVFDITVLSNYVRYSILILRLGLEYILLFKIYIRLGDIDIRQNSILESNYIAQFSYLFSRNIKI